MPLPQLSGGYRCISRFSNVSGGTEFSVLMDYLEATQTSNLEQELAEAVRDIWDDWFTNLFTGTTNTMASYISTEVDLQEVLCYDLDGSSAAAVEPGLATSGGASGGDALPPDLAVVHSKRTNFRGRSGRGRFYMAGWTTNILAGGQSGLLDATFLDDVRIAATAIWTSDRITASGTFSPIVIANQAVGQIPVGRFITAVTVDQHFDVQRRRGNA